MELRGILAKRVDFMNDYCEDLHHYTMGNGRIEKAPIEIIAFDSENFFFEMGEHEEVEYTIKDLQEVAYDTDENLCIMEFKSKGKIIEVSGKLKQGAPTPTAYKIFQRNNQFNVVFDLR